MEKWKNWITKILKKLKNWKIYDCVAANSFAKHIKIVLVGTKQRKKKLHIIYYLLAFNMKLPIIQWSLSEKRKSKQQHWLAEVEPGRIPE